MPSGEENFSSSHRVAWMGVGIAGHRTVVQNESPPTVGIFSCLLSRFLPLRHLDAVGDVGRCLFRVCVGLDPGETGVKCCPW